MRLRTPEQLAEVGISVIPLWLGTKVPALQAGEVAPYKEHAADVAKVEFWRRHHGRCNWAVIVGEVSGGLVVVDFDDFDGYLRWSAQYPDIAQAAPTVLSSRGVHVWVVVTGPMQRTTRKIGNGYAGEVKGNGLVLIPDSVHPSGAVYRWVHGGADFIPTVTTLAEIGIAHPEPRAPAPARSAGGAGAAGGPRRILPCMARVLADETTPAGGRHHMALRLALHLHAEGWSERQTLRLVDGWRERSDLELAEVESTVNWAYNHAEGSSHGCNSAELAPYCDPGCALARWRIRDEC